MLEILLQKGLNTVLEASVNQTKELVGSDTIFIQNNDLKSGRNNFDIELIIATKMFFI